MGRTNSPPSTFSVYLPPPSAISQRTDEHVCVRTYYERRQARVSPEDRTFDLSNVRYI